MPQVGWTRSDQAELDAILWFWLGRFEEHQAECGVCRPRLWCSRLSASWDAVESWVSTRRLLSRAEHLRACQRLEADARNSYAPTVDRQTAGA